MLEYVTEEEYKEMMQVTSIPAEFDRLNIEASNYINYKTFGRIDLENISKKVKYVTCLIINLINEENTKLENIGTLKSENVEGWSQSYATPEEIEKEYQNKENDLLNKYLAFEIGKDGNYLLYSGV